MPSVLCCKRKRRPEVAIIEDRDSSMVSWRSQSGGSVPSVLCCMRESVMGRPSTKESDRSIVRRRSQATDCTITAPFPTKRQQVGQVPLEHATCVYRFHSNGAACVRRLHSTCCTRDVHHLASTCPCDPPMREHLRRCNTWDRTPARNLLSHIRVLRRCDQ
jgi:GTP cyclohydrolase II